MFIIYIFVFRIVKNFVLKFGKFLYVFGILSKYE